MEKTKSLNNFVASVGKNTKNNLACVRERGNQLFSHKLSNFTKYTKEYECLICSKYQTVVILHQRTAVQTTHTPLQKNQLEKVDQFSARSQNAKSDTCTTHRTAHI